MVLRLEGVEKRFGGTRALADVSLRFRPGTVHSLVGENGAGKSTLGKVIAGSVAPDAGEIFLGERRLSFGNPRDAIANGIFAIRQEISLVPNMSVMENVFLGRERLSYGLLAKSRMASAYRELAGRAGFEEIPARARAGSLNISDQQKVEIMRALAINANVIVFDEPTAALSHDQSERLFGVIRSLRDSGKTIIFISHFLDDVLRISDEVSVLRNGRLVFSDDAQAQTASSLIRGMLGRELESQFPRRHGQPRRDLAPVIRVRNLSRAPDLSDIGFDLHPGEILGIGGLLGSGRTEVLRAIFGADARDRGEIMLDGKVPLGASPSDSIRKGVVLLPESRRDQGLVLGRSAADNIALSRLDKVCSASVIRSRRLKAAVEAVMGRLKIVPAQPRYRVEAMSGGNQQKVAFGKLLFTDPRVMLIDEPTRGVDVGAKFSIYETIFSIADAGVPIILVSSEIEELMGLADRILVMRGGRIVLERERADVTEKQIIEASFASVDEGQEA